MAGSAPLTNHWFNLWHGTDRASAQNIIKAGVLATPPRPGLDFGPGFYLTSKKSQAQAWANIRAMIKSEPPALVGFVVFHADLSLLRQVSFIRSDRSANEFWSFVRDMKGGTHTHHFDTGYYDFVCGPVTRKPKYFDAYPDSDQFSFHGERGTEFINSCQKRLEYANGSIRFGP